MIDIGNVKTGGFVLRQSNALIRDMRVDYKSDLDTAETLEAKPIPVPGGRSDGSGDDAKKTSQRENRTIVVKGPNRKTANTTRALKNV